MWYYYEILKRVTLEVIGSGRVWATCAEDAQQIANSRVGAGAVASEIKPLNESLSAAKTAENE